MSLISREGYLPDVEPIKHPQSCATTCVKVDFFAAKAQTFHRAVGCFLVNKHDFRLLYLKPWFEHPDAVIRNEQRIVHKNGSWLSHLTYITQKSISSGGMFSSIAKEVCDDDSYYCLHHLSLSPTAAAAAMVSEMTQLHQIITTLCMVPIHRLPSGPARGCRGSSGVIVNFVLFSSLACVPQQ